MGRLQRKKTAAKKKSKKVDANAPSTGQTSGETASAQGAISGGVVRETAKNQPLVRRKPTSPAKPAAVKSGNNYLNRALQFLREVKVELKKVTWPTRKQTLGSTAVVIVLVMIISLFLGLVDIGLSSLIRLILQ